MFSDSIHSFPTCLSPKPCNMSIVFIYITFNPPCLCILFVSVHGTFTIPPSVNPEKPPIPKDNSKLIFRQGKSELLQPIVGTCRYHILPFVFKVFIKFTQDQRFHLRYWHSLLGAWRVFRVCLGSDPLSTVMYCKWLPPVRFIESPRWKWDRGGFETTDPKWGPRILVGTRLVDGRVFLSTSGWFRTFFVQHFLSFSLCQ